MANAAEKARLARLANEKMNELRIEGGVLMRYTLNERGFCIPDDVVEIGPLAFEGNDELETLEIGKNVRRIHMSAFKGCVNLKIIMAPKFNGWPHSSNNETPYYLKPWLEIEFIEDPEEGLYGPFSYGASFRYPEWNWKDIEEMSFVHEHISPFAFHGCRLRKVELSDCDIGESAFRGNPYLQEIFLSDAGSVGDYAFADGGRLRNVTLYQGIRSLGKGVFEKSGLQSVRYLGSSQDTPMGRGHTFEGIDTLRSVSASSCCFSPYDFAGCRNLERLDVEYTFENDYIGSHAFDGCESLRNLCVAHKAYRSLFGGTVPQMIPAIHANAFDNCPNLTLYLGVSKPLFGLPREIDKKWSSDGSAKLVYDPDHRLGDWRGYKGDH